MPSPLRSSSCAVVEPRAALQKRGRREYCKRVRYLEDRFQLADDTAAVTGQLVNLMGGSQIAGKQVHDVNIVATMQAYSIPALLTHNTKDFERFGEMIRIEGI